MAQHPPPPPATNPWEGPERRTSLVPLADQVEKLREVVIDTRRQMSETRRDVTNLGVSVSELGTTVANMLSEFTHFCQKYGTFLDDTLESKIRRDKRLEVVCEHLLKNSAWAIVCTCVAVGLYAAHHYLGIHGG